LVLGLGALAVVPIRAEEGPLPKAHDSLIEEVVLVEGRTIHLRIPRGHSGIIVPYDIGENAEILVTGEDGRPVEGRLEDLRPHQWIRGVVEAGTRRLIRIEPSAAPWLGTTPTRSTRAEPSANLAGISNAWKGAGRVFPRLGP